MAHLILMISSTHIGYVSHHRCFMLVENEQCFGQDWPCVLIFCLHLNTYLYNILDSFTKFVIFKIYLEFLSTISYVWTVRIFMGARRYMGDLLLPLLWCPITIALVETFYRYNITMLNVNDAFVIWGLDWTKLQLQHGVDHIPSFTDISSTSMQHVFKDPVNTLNTIKYRSKTKLKRITSIYIITLSIC